MRRLIFVFFLLATSPLAYTQISGSITVGGDFDKFYPVSWVDANWSTGYPTEVYIGRPDVHENSTWRGSLMSCFRFHTTQWGNGSNHINSSIYFSIVPFIAGWKDVSNTNSDMKIVIWLRGGGTTYRFTANTAVAPQIYDGVQNALPYQQTNGPAYSFKTSVDDYVNSSGSNEQTNIQAYGSGFFLENVGIGTTDTKNYRLAVAGKAVAEEVVVKLKSAWPDYVFEETHKLPSLSDLQEFVRTNKHLPEVPTAEDVKQNGLSLGEMNAILLKKVEELTMYVIEQQKEIERLKKHIYERK